MAVWALLFGCGGIRLDEATVAEFTQIRDDALAAARPLDEERKLALVQAKARIGPRPDLGPCPAAARRAEDDDVGAFTENLDAWHVSKAPYNVLPESMLMVQSGPRFYRLDAGLFNDVDGLLYRNWRAKDEAEIAAKLARARELAAPGWQPYDGTLVIDYERKPMINADNTGFIGGEIRGRFYLWGYAEHAIVCAANATAVNSERIGVHQFGGGFGDGAWKLSAVDLERDLYRNGVNAAIDNLAIAGPYVFTSVGVIH